jgi:hypothetical protein
MGTVLQAKVAKLLHKRLGYDRLLKEEVPSVVYPDTDGRLFNAPVFSDPHSTLRFKLTGNSIEGITYSLLLYHSEFQFAVSHRDGTITLRENYELSDADVALLGQLLRHLQKASERTLVRRPKSNKPIWRRFFERRRSKSD